MVSTGSGKVHENVLRWFALFSVQTTTCAVCHDAATYEYAKDRSLPNTTLLYYGMLYFILVQNHIGYPFLDWKLASRIGTF